MPTISYVWGSPNSSKMADVGRKKDWSWWISPCTTGSRGRQANAKSCLLCSDHYRGSLWLRIPINILIATYSVMFSVELLSSRINMEANKTSVSNQRNMEVEQGPLGCRITSLYRAIIGACVHDHTLLSLYNFSEQPVLMNPTWTSRNHIDGNIRFPLPDNISCF